MSGFRVGSQQAEGRTHFLQYVSGKAATSLAYEVIPDFAEVFLSFGG
jgi:hypothetical protein